MDPGPVARSVSLFQQSLDVRQTLRPGCLKEP